MSESGEGNYEPSASNKVDYRDYKYIGSKIARIDTRIKEQGLSSAINSIFEERGIHINQVISEHTKEALSTKPALVIATHPDIGADPLAILGAIPRDRRDVSVAAGEWADRLGENVSEHVITIKGTAEQPTNNRGIVLLRKALKGYLKLDHSRSSSELGRAHVESMRQARERINAGGILVIFPEGAGGRDAEWNNGVADVILRSENSDLNVIFAKTMPSEKWRNRARLMAPLARGVFGSTTINVDFSDPHNVEEYLGGRRHDVTQILRGQYEEFVAGIK